MQKNNITTELEAQQKFLLGIEQVSEIIRPSYGPKGGNIAIEQPFYPFHIVANDAQSIIQAIHIDDPVERRGLNFIKELSDKATKDSGEGRKTTIIIAEELLKNGQNLKIKGVELKEQLDYLLPVALEAIEAQSTTIPIENIGQVAKTSSRSEEIGNVIGEIYQKIGENGIITVETSGIPETIYEITDGVRFKDASWITPFMANDNKVATYNNPIILVTKQKITKDSDISDLVDYSIKQSKGLVIFTDDMDNNVASRLVATHRAGVAKILVIKAPILWKNELFEDFAKCVGATIVEEASGLKLGSKLPLEVLGTCDKLITDSEDTILQGIKDISQHKDDLRAKGDDTSLLRVYWLNTKSAVLKVGASSESELSYKRLKAQDAVNACRLALGGGIVKGGGISLVIASDKISENIAGDIFRKALIEPNRQLIRNGGDDFNPDNAIDATLVVKNAVRNALSLAGIALTTTGDIRLPEKSFEDKQLEILNSKRMPF